LAPSACRASERRQCDFVSFLDSSGVYYDSISDVIDLGKAVCTSTRRTGATDMAINGLVAAGYYSDVERGAFLIGAANSMCPDIWPAMNAHAAQIAWRAGFAVGRASAMAVCRQCGSRRCGRRG
jgi:Protein of unknown function (DUF732)